MEQQIGRAVDGQLALVLGFLHLFQDVLQIPLDRFRLLLQGLLLGLAALLLLPLRILQRHYHDVAPLAPTHAIPRTHHELVSADRERSKPWNAAFPSVVHLRPILGALVDRLNTELVLDALCRREGAFADPLDVDPALLQAVGKALRGHHGGLALVRRAQGQRPDAFAGLLPCLLLSPLLQLLLGALHVLLGRLHRVLLLLRLLLFLFLRVHVVNRLLHQLGLLLLTALLQPLHVVGHLQVFVPLLFRAQHVVRLGDPLVKLVIGLGGLAVGDLVRVVLQAQVPHLFAQEPQVVLLREVHFLERVFDLLVFLLQLAAQHIDADLVILAGQVLRQLLTLALEARLQHLPALDDLLRQLLRLLVRLGFLLLIGGGRPNVPLDAAQHLIVLLADLL
mmetsp:Transcript_62643/g.191624  ORF Transcript_62643/g.191624 Transcript_62643/m.191624 type:complete len:393 (+) Transcript_62643:238-1416(+)